MIKKINNVVFVFPSLMGFLFTTSCQYSGYPNSFPVHDIPIDNINTYIQIYLPYGWNDFLIGGPLAIGIDNISDETIAFPADYNIQSYFYSDDKWTLIDKHHIERLDGYLIMKPSKGDPSKTLGAVIYPIIENTRDPIDLRVVITGNIFRNGKPTDIKVGAFTDVTLYPSTEY